MIRNILGKRNYFFLFLLLSFLLLSTEAGAEGVSARYLQNSATSSILELTIENPAPSSVIVKQNIPSGTRIKGATPSYSKFAAGKGVVTWLFKRPSPGVKRIRMDYSRPLSTGGVTAVIRCKSPSTGQLMTIHVQ
jgi:uncharacterized protein (DUF58 family)